MKIKYLGTAAAEGIPSLFCECPKCQLARKLRGREIRTRAQALIDDKLLLDFGPDSFEHFLKYHIDSGKIHSVIITHVHSDHFYPADFEFMKKGFSVRSAGNELTIYGSEEIAPLLDKWIHLDDARNQGLKFQVLKAFETIEIEGYSVTPLKANHGTEHPFIYLISDGKKTMLYDHDCGFFPKETWDYLLSHSVHLDYVSFDATRGNDPFFEHDYGHTSVPDDIHTKAELLAHHLADEKTVMVLSHFSHNGPLNNYKTMRPIAEKEGLIVAYDGLEINF